MGHLDEVIDKTKEFGLSRIPVRFDKVRDDITKSALTNSVMIEAYPNLMVY